METVAVYVDDADHALRVLAAQAARPTRWVLVVCAPRVTQRIGKWVAHSSREQWRRRWSDKLAATLAPALAATHGSAVELVVAKAPLDHVLADLRMQHGGDLRVVDARRPKQPPPMLTWAGIAGLFAWID